MRSYAAAVAALPLLTFGTGVLGATVAPEPTDTAAPVASVVINEVESNGDVEGDWVELYNLDANAAADISGYVIKDSEDDHILTIPEGTSIESGGYLALLTEPNFGLGGADSVRLFDPAGGLIDAFEWTAHATTSYGRCPDGTGDFITTGAPSRGLANVCDSEPTFPVGAPWPGSQDVTVVDPVELSAEDLSGLAFEGTGDDAVLWAVENGDGRLLRLQWDAVAGRWLPSAGWDAGVRLRYPDGTGVPDSEGVTVLNGSIYVATERDNDNGDVSRPAVLRFSTDIAASVGAVSAQMVWDLTSDLPGLGANAGLEAITFIDDATLTAGGLLTDAGSRYDPSAFGPHGGGVFFVGVEGTGDVIGYVLADDGSFQRIVTITSGFSGVMELAYLPQTGQLWVVCDEVCGGATQTFTLDGSFTSQATYARPSGMANLANEGFAIRADAACSEGSLAVVWADDADTDSHSLRQGTLDCTTQSPTDSPTDQPTDSPMTTAPTASPSTTGPGTVDPMPTPSSSVSTPQPVDPAQLTAQARSFVSVQATAEAGERVTLTISGVGPGQVVHVWLYSEPVLLATAAVGADQTVTVTIPRAAEVGSHRIVVTWAENTLIGWAPLQVVAGAGVLATTGVGVGVGAVALVLVVMGASLLLVRRRVHR